MSSCNTVCMYYFLIAVAKYLVRSDLREEGSVHYDEKGMEPVVAEAACSHSGEQKPSTQTVLTL